MRRTSHILVIATIFFFTLRVSALDNGLRVPPLGWSSWYGFTSKVNETMLRDMASGMVKNGLNEVGFKMIWLDDGWAIGRDSATGEVIEDPKLFPSGMGNLSAFIHSLGLQFGIYTSKGPLTCLGYQKTQPNRPGSCGYEKVDAHVYVNKWNVDAVKDDGCGPCAMHDPFAAMRDALNGTGKPIWYAIHPSKIANSSYPDLANMWRTGGDLYASSFDMWTNRLDLATAKAQAILTGPGAFPNPDFLEVGYSPRAVKGKNAMSITEQQAMFTMWSMLPGPLILSADLRSPLDDEIKMILLNTEVIAINQDPKAVAMNPIRRNDGIEVWSRSLSNGNIAIVMFNRNVSNTPSNGTAQEGRPITFSAEHSECVHVQLSNGTIQAKSDDPTIHSLCLSSVGVCKCANPPSPQMGFARCNKYDPTQRWSLDVSSKQVNNDRNHDLNVGPICPGSDFANVLLYPTQGHNNEHFTYDENFKLLYSGEVSGGKCLTMAPQSGGKRKIQVFWKELGFSKSDKFLVRDLWAKQDLGIYMSNFSAVVDWHDARIFVLSKSL